MNLPKQNRKGKKCKKKCNGFFFFCKLFTSSKNANKMFEKTQMLPKKSKFETFWIRQKKCNLCNLFVPLLEISRFSKNVQGFEERFQGTNIFFVKLQIEIIIFSKRSAVREEASSTTDHFNFMASISNSK